MQPCRVAEHRRRDGLHHRRGRGHPWVRLCRGGARSESCRPCRATGATRRVSERRLAALRSTESPLDVASTRSATRRQAVAPVVLRVLRLPKSDLAIPTTRDQMPALQAPRALRLLVSTPQRQRVDPFRMKELVLLAQNEGEPRLLLRLVHLRQTYLNMLELL